jgi:hypothetical protein
MKKPVEYIFTAMLEKRQRFLKQFLIVKVFGRIESALQRKKKTTGKTMMKKG